jgi:hypothetical protein
MKDKVKVTISYSWEFDSNQWDETKLHWEKVNEDISKQIMYDPVNMFFCLRNITNPSLESFKVKKD